MQAKKISHKTRDDEKELLVNPMIKLKLARVEKDLSQEELAKSVGVSRQTIGLIELGTIPP